ncbi:MAG: GGDEF domain-containing protein [Acidimicrobiales bacterium]
MTTKHALPGLFAGAFGLVVGVVGFVTDQAFAGVIAGLLALAAAAACVRLASRLEDEELRRSRLEEADKPAAAAEAIATHDALPNDGEVEDGVEDDVEVGVEVEVGVGDELADPGETADVEVDELAEIEDVEALGGDEAALDPGRSDDESTGLIDSSTGLFSEGFFHVVLETRVAAARRHLRPVAVVLVEVVRGLPADDPTAIDAHLVADIFAETLREADTACRLESSGYFALLLEDTPENGAIWTVERIRRQLVATQDGVTVRAGIACYPAHAFTPEGILDAAEQALVSAREWRQDRIEVAATLE